MKVSVVIPSYNNESLVIEAIQSVYNQAPDPCYQIYEVIVVDDGSMDRTEQVIEAYRTEHRLDTLIYIKQQNGGPSAARNTGMLRATGDVIAFLDSDDLWLQDKLKHQVIEFQRNSQVGLVYGQYINRVYQKNNEYDEYPVIKRFYKGRIKKELLLLNFIGTSTVVIKREAVTRVGLFNTKIRLAEDYDYWLRIADHYEASYCESPAYIRRFYGEHNTSGGRSMKMLYSTREVISSHIRTLDLSDQREVLIAQDISEIQTYILLGDKMGALRKIANSRTSGLLKAKYALLALVPIKFIHHLKARRGVRLSGSLRRE
ncbi:glycosyltransferase family 2 protein [Paenibacillus mendelii]|uniref:Glycosyltransferase family 2 protein n=1 Tax=Paenibacillus mendelii TaxID=206163 RepID=A0ABV6JJ55_9BACL|nr:glycosyltransferase family A protein [Paenibacillus mendelii]MCQ6558876.1 glycosyltransferase family 2 protein [Paenibacillus mendelii]